MPSTPRKVESGAAELRVDLALAGAVREVVLAPALHADDAIALAKLGVARLDHFADGSAVEHLADLEGRHVRLDVAHAAAHVRVDRHVQVAHQSLALAGAR